MRIKKNTSKIIIALAVAFLATMISYSSFNNMNKQLTDQQKMIEYMQKNKAQNYQDNYAYAIATKDLKAGEPVSDMDVDFKQTTVLDKNAFENRSDVVNKVLLKDINIGDVFTTSHIAKISNDDVTLKEGYRALTLPADNFQGKSSKMVPGTSVDIYSASQDDPWTLENIRIISFEGAKSLTPEKLSGTSNVDINSATAITFEVSANSIADFISSISKNKLVLVARNPNDKKVTYQKKKNYSASKSSYSSLPKLPASVPISSMPDQGLSGLPQPLKPEIVPQSVELIEANVKSKVTFD